MSIDNSIDDEIGYSNFFFKWYLIINYCTYTAFLVFDLSNSTFSQDSDFDFWPNRSTGYVNLIKLTGFTDI